MSAVSPAPVPGASLSFSDLGLPPLLLEALNAVGYETPSPIQAETIPHLLAHRDVIGQAQTGTGKTAAFALPLLACIDMAVAKPQALILAPTRELAIQVAEALQKYASRMPGFHVLPIYGGQSYQPQLSALRRGVHAIVGTPGRVIDHLERGSLRLDALKLLVLDEADEMLRMGFIDDVETILKKTPGEKQVALFSATMPPAIRRIAQTYLRNPAEVTIASKTRTATTVRQRCLVLPVHAKLDALTRILEVEPFEAMIVFTRTKIATEELAGKLAARGYSVAALNGDIPQQQRERTVNKLKEGSLDIIVATDVAARGLDVERVSHVLNYDTPTDPESYVHRIGRTGRAGRSGEAILFITPRERALLSMIERATRKHIEQMELPSDADLNARRTEKFRQQVAEALTQTSRLAPMRELVTLMERELGQSATDIAAALALMAQGQGAAAAVSGAAQPRATPVDTRQTSGGDDTRGARPQSLKKVFLRGSEDPAVRRPTMPFRESASPRGATEAADESRRPSREDSARPRRPAAAKSDEGMETYRIEVGRSHGVLPKNIVGAIANEAGLESENIGRIEIRDDHSLIDLPEGMPKNIYQHLRKVWVAGRKLEISRVAGSAGPGSGKRDDPASAKMKLLAPGQPPRKKKPRY